jgi:hypothetical protein
MAKKKAAAEPVKGKADKRSVLRELLRKNIEVSTRDAAEHLLHAGFTVPDFDDRSEGAKKEQATFTTYVSQNKSAIRKELGMGAPVRGAARSTSSPGVVDLSIAVSLSEAAGSTSNAAAILEVVSRLDIAAARKALAKLVELEEALGKDNAKKAVATLFGNTVGNG